ncbi:MAG: acetyl-CoA carboxylase carboxyltransferase subunit alpha [Candidatus Latescibacteria bacterium]|nr:acetyl-CoA carboxylase carboxyltransferase subunit alpha [Candidatus Latescibacterota bacterium]
MGVDNDAVNRKVEFVLDFERPIVDLENRIQELKAHATRQQVDMSDEIAQLERRVSSLQQETYSNLTRWQRVQLARHPMRPYSLDYLGRMFDEFIEIHGDRCFADDLAIVGGFAWLDGEPIVVIGQQKGRNTRERQIRNFGMPNPEGYRKALRLMKLAAKFQRPVLTLIDTPGAYPGIGAEERGQAEAIARNLYEMSHLPIPIVVAIIGEGASGGALGIGVGDRILMMENAWYSVINPQSCAIILFKSREKQEEMADALRLTAQDLLDLRIIDSIVPEPFGGAHRAYDLSADLLKERVKQAFAELLNVPVDLLIKQRVEKFSRMGVWEE